uniref:Uncharacterized protein n=1 Tax=Nelumbo nucifera TaxID=4432 RepID=A0A822Z0X4_NELNU|nr:TPA_asm: hypothetical protein HUJ06_005767 [Nelumbo nucifera]
MDRSPGKLFEDRSRDRRLTSEENSDGILPEKRLFRRFRICNFRQSMIC